MSEAEIPMAALIPLPETDQPKKVEESANCMNENLASAMSRRGVYENGQWVPMQAKHIFQNAKIPWGTLQDYMTGRWATQQTNEHLLNLITYLETTADWLCFGVGIDNENLVKFKDLSKNEEKSA